MAAIHALSGTEDKLRMPVWFYDWNNAPKFSHIDHADLAERLRTTITRMANKPVVTTADNTSGSLHSGRLSPAVPHFKRSLRNESVSIIIPNRRLRR
jgi:hypothetical protein